MTKFSPQWLRNLRKKLNLTQEMFAARYGISLRTIQKWEQGDRIPEGPALSYLKVIEQIPDAVAQALR